MRERERERERGRERGGEREREADRPKAATEVTVAQGTLADTHTRTQKAWRQADRHTPGPRRHGDRPTDTHQDPEGMETGRQTNGEANYRTAHCRHDAVKACIPLCVGLLRSYRPETRTKSCSVFIAGVLNCAMCYDSSLELCSVSGLES